jgi:glycosyltransferase involved in cell wall biosynthesis
MVPGSVVVHAASSAFQEPGGGECQLVQTARHLEELGVIVRPFVPWTDLIEEARLLHLFGMSREGLALARVAKARRVPVVLSPIFWVEPRAVLSLAGNAFRGGMEWARWTLRRLPVPDWRRELVALADRVLPNSMAEARQLVRYCGADPERVRVVPNGVDERFAAVSQSWPRDRVLYVGRIEPRKNVLGLIRALRPMGLPLEVIGGVVPAQEPYARACREAGGKLVTFLDRLPHDHPALEDAYARARVLALPSWFETPGLVALEAALAGCAVVLTPYGSTRETFGDLVEYTRPHRLDEVRRAVARAWDQGPSPELSALVRRRYLWSHVAQQTAEAYDEIAG